MGRVEIPARKWIKKAPLWCQQLTRGVCNNIADILVKVWGSGVKVRFLDPPFGRELAKLWKKCTAQVGANRFLIKLSSETL